MNEMKKQALGRGLSALLGSTNDEPSNYTGQASHELLLDKIVPGKHQPRTFFSEEELESLSQSIKEKGVLQPILVRHNDIDPNQYEIIAGERRWRASKMAGLSSIPVIVRDFSDSEILEVGLLENIQREDLNPIEEAEGYRRLAEEFNHTQESLARILGKSRSHIANTLRLLTLPKKVKDYLMEGKLTAGHGRSLVGVDDAEALADQIVLGKLSVRETENLSKRGYAVNGYERGALPIDPEQAILKNHLTELLGMPVELNLKGYGGKIVISFKSPTELDQLIQKLNGISQSGKKQEFHVETVG